MHDLLITSMPILAVMFGILLNRQEATTTRNEMKAELAQMRSELRGEINALRSETIALRDSIHRDMIGLHEHLAVVESKQNS